MEYDIFREQLALKYPAYGHALWEPNPWGLYSAVQVGDVGFIREGKFHRLFNVLLPEDHPSHENFGVPEHHKPLKPKIQRHIYPGQLSPNNFRSKAVMPMSDQDAILSAPGPEPSRVTFTCSRRQGAILSLPVPAQREDTFARGDFAKYICKHIDVWFKFARELGLGIDRMEDIILVTGRDLARSWNNVAFSENQGGEQVSFGVQVTGVADVEWQLPLEDMQGVAVNRGPSGLDLPENQCIFVRGFRVTRILGIIPRLRGAAGPSSGSDQDEPPSDRQLLNYPPEINYRDPLHTLLDYLAAHAPESDMALVHDDDLVWIMNNIDLLEDLQPDAVLGGLRNTRPPIGIRPTQCDLSSASESNSRATSTVASLLSRDVFEDPTDDPDSIYAWMESANAFAKALLTQCYYPSSPSSGSPRNARDSSLRFETNLSSGSGLVIPPSLPPGMSAQYFPSPHAAATHVATSPGLVLGLGENPKGKGVQRRSPTELMPGSSLYDPMGSQSSWSTPRVGTASEPLTNESGDERDSDDSVHDVRDKKRRYAKTFRDVEKQLFERLRHRLFPQDPHAKRSECLERAIEAIDDLSFLRNGGARQQFEIESLKQRLAFAERTIECLHRELDGRSLAVDVDK